MSEIEETTEETTEKPKSLSLLASEHFGNDFHGEVTEVQEETQEENQEEAEQKPDDETQEETQETQEETETEETETDEDSETISSVEDFVEYMRTEHQMEVDSEWFESLEIKGNARGKEVTYTLGALKEAAQKVDTADDILSQAKSKAKVHAEEAEQKSIALNQQYTITSKLITEAEGLLSAEESSIDWDKLRTEDTAEWTAKRAELQERQGAINQIKSAAATEYQTWVDTQESERQVIFAEQIQVEHQLLLEKIPEWKDQEKGKAGKTKLVEYLISQGFTKEELVSSADHRLLYLAEKARLYDERADAGEVTKKKLKKIPKVLKPGAPKRPGQVKKEKIGQLEKTARESGSLDDAFRLMKANREK